MSRTKCLSIGVFACLATIGLLGCSLPGPTHEPSRSLTSAEVQQLEDDATWTRLGEDLIERGQQDPGVIHSALDDLASKYRASANDKMLWRIRLIWINVWGQARAKTQKSDQEIDVETRPVGATLYIDNKKLGETPLTFNLDRGGDVYSIRLEKDGFRPYETTLRGTQFVVGRYAQWAYEPGELIVRLRKQEETLPEVPPATVGGPLLGVEVKLLSDDLSRPCGVTVIGVMPNSPAAHSAVAVGDSILEVAGEKIPDVNDFLAAMRRRKAGDAVQLKILRGGVERTIEVTFGARE